MRGLAAAVLASFALVPGGIAAGSAPQQPRSAELIIKGRVTQVHSAKLFTIRGDVAGESEVLVVPPRPISTSILGFDVEVHGLLRRFNSAELGASWKDIDEDTRRSFSGRRVLVASSLIAAAPGETSSTEKEAPSATAEEASYALPIGRPTLHLLPTTLVAFINEFAGQHVSIRFARVVGVYEPGAFLVEPLTRYQMMMDYRDRILVLVDAAQLTVQPEEIVSATVAVEGTARTLSDLRITARSRWPGKLTPELVKRLEVRAGILATSVRTPDGTELTTRRVASR